MALYFPTPPTGAIQVWIAEELRRIADAINAPTEIGAELHAEPDKLYDGLTVLADGSDWNPGAGQGVYTYYNSGWNKLG